MSENPSAIIESIRARAGELYTEIVGLRRDIHRHPELSFQEFRTTSLIREYLLKHGVTVEHDFLDTGVVALLKGEKQDGPERGLVALRADIDALPLQEENHHDFCSVEEGIMHACGHDMHTAILLGTAALLSGMREELRGDVLFIFQPAEEKAPGGASPLIEAGLFEQYRPSAIFGLHCFPHIQSGRIALREGSLMAAADELYITVNGEGGHASAPHKAADPVLAAAHIITSLQHLVSRVASPYEPAVLSISSINGGHATNIIPSKVVMTGTLRTMNEELRSLLHRRLKTDIEHTALAMGVEAELTIVNGYPVLVNDHETTRKLREFSADYLGVENVEESEPVMTAEDFSHYLRYCPGSFMQLGTGRKEPQKGDWLHSPYFNPDESSIVTGMGVMSYAAWSWLKARSSGNG
ncbi:MAG: amidohydrolase [Chlorobium phaeobacteroides]|uniref:Amidohydrolase n=1 Tax=Chlorobium phaeobacteroides (strain BS1) TaxID=331678 RepID=B3EJ54_CHLPB|nr:amidohydrolase [Chlorobium phaeobacteroides]